MIFLLKLLDKSYLCRYNNIREKIGPVVQLVRTPACHAGGRGFEPHPGRHVAASLLACRVFFVEIRLVLTAAAPL